MHTAHISYDACAFFAACILCPCLLIFRLDTDVFFLGTANDRTGTKASGEEDDDDDDEGERKPEEEERIDWCLTQAEKQPLPSLIRRKAAIAWVVEVGHRNPP
eukprot:CAMPEP_0170173274 /NCGR_PEP_ID=MMETSP0040_2-20121228/6543_1 /TAXON_ID=641309 /ORGANISM="Lotharella oceanica, Strain CCMP622" /LENGTH=102 /DNA_ID=CAMNT_0010414367 /DNA_START=346 /DNA_END=650 /DNA_ORIENTATION=+